MYVELPGRGPSPRLPVVRVASKADAGAALLEINLEDQGIVWWAHKDSNLGPAD